MADLRTRYMGLELRNPVIVGSCGLTHSVSSIKRLEEHGAGAVVLKSLFEEQILIETDNALQESGFRPEAADYLDYYVKQDHLERYLGLIKEAKKSVGIPVIASIACISPTNWPHFAGRIQKAGADGLELNVFILPSDPAMEGDANEKVCFDIVRAVQAETDIPISLKVSYYYTNLASMLQRLSRTGIGGLVLFNRFYNPDIDIEEQAPAPGFPYSSPRDIYISLRWVAMTSGMLSCDIAASTGIHDGEGVIKQILAGAKAVQMVSAVYQEGAEVIAQATATLNDWMDRHGYATIEDFRGALCQSHVPNPAFYERVQFLKHFGQI